MKNKLKNIVIALILIFIIVILSIIYTNNNSTNLEIDYKYTNINIDSNQLNIFYFNVGQADCTLITINNKNMLIDSGQDSDGEYIVEFLEEKNIKKLDYFIITHGDIDHSGGAKDIINSIDIENIFMPQGIIESEEEYQEIKELAEKQKIQMPKVEVDQEFALDVASFEVISVKNNIDCEPNDSSIVIRLNYLNTNYLFMGDASSEVEKELIKKYPELKADVLKVSHHGSSTGTCSEFLDVVRPKVALISCGKNNRYNHPNEDVLLRLKDYGVKIYRSDLMGMVKIVYYGNDNYIYS